MDASTRRGFGGLLQRPKSEDVVLAASQLRAEAAGKDTAATKKGKAKDEGKLLKNLMAAIEARREIALDVQQILLDPVGERRRDVELELRGVDGDALSELRAHLVGQGGVRD